MASAYIYAYDPVTALIVGVLLVLLVQLLILLVLVAVTAHRSHRITVGRARAFRNLAHPVHLRRAVG